MNKRTICQTCLNTFLYIIDIAIFVCYGLRFYFHSFVIHSSVHLHGFKLILLHVSYELSVAVQIWILCLQLGSNLTYLGFLILTKSIYWSLNMMLAWLIYHIFLTIRQLDVYSVFMLNEAFQLVCCFVSILIVLFDLRRWRSIRRFELRGNCISFITGWHIVIAFRVHFVLIPAMLCRQFCTLCCLLRLNYWLWALAWTRFKIVRAPSIWIALQPHILLC